MNFTLAHSLTKDTASGIQHGNGERETFVLCTCASGEPGSEPGSMVAEELQGSRSERSSLEVALEQVSRPLSVVVGLETDEAALSEHSMNGTPPRKRCSHTQCNIMPLHRVSSCSILLAYNSFSFITCTLVLPHLLGLFIFVSYVYTCCIVAGAHDFGMQFSLHNYTVAVHMTKKPFEL